MRGGWAHALAATAIVGATIGLLRGLRRGGAGSWTDVAAFAAASGGLGMAAGWHLDRVRLTNVPEWCAPGTGNGIMGTTIDWSQGLMFAACVGSIAVAARFESAQRKSTVLWLKAAGCLSGMWLGMIVGGHLLPSVFARLVGEEAAMHVAMVIGMTIGAATTHATLWSTRTAAREGKSIDAAELNVESVSLRPRR